jgi:hypothetical protein
VSLGMVCLANPEVSADSATLRVGNSSSSRTLLAGVIPPTQIDILIVVSWQLFRTAARGPNAGMQLIAVSSQPAQLWSAEFA